MRRRMSLQGADALRRRLRAIQAIGKGSGGDSLPRRWQTATVRAARPQVPARTGATRRSIRPGRISGDKATVVGKYTVNFIDAGSKAHAIPRQAGLTKTGRVSRRKVGSGKVLKFQAGGQTIFRKKVNKPRIAARPFKKEAARKGLASLDFLGSLINAWNRAA